MVWLELTSWTWLTIIVLICPAYSDRRNFTQTPSISEIRICLHYITRILQFSYYHDYRVLLLTQLTVFTLTYLFVTLGSLGQQVYCRPLCVPPAVGRHCLDTAPTQRDNVIKNNYWNSRRSWGGVLWRPLGCPHIVSGADFFILHTHM